MLLVLSMRPMQAA